MTEETDLYSFVLVQNEDDGAKCWYELEANAVDRGLLLVTNFVGGRCPIKPTQIIDAKEAECFADLPWEGTILNDRSYPTGWLDRRGKFYGCAGYAHIRCAEYAIGESPYTLEKKGWVHVARDPDAPNPAGDRTWHLLHHRLTAAQRNWLLRRGHLLEDDD